MLKKHVVFNLRKGMPKMLPKSRVKRKINIDLKTLLFFAFMVCGIIIGAFIYNKASDEALRFLNKIFSGFLLPGSTEMYFSSYLKMLLPFFSMVILCFITGFSGMGTPFLCLVPFVSGIFAGVYISLCYNSFALKEILCRVVVFLPVYATATATLIKCCCRSSVISGEIFTYLLTGKGEGQSKIKGYVTDYLVFLLFVALGCLASLVAFILINKLFNIFS